MAQNHWREHLEHHPQVESCEPRLLMTAAPTGVVLNTTTPANDGKIDRLAVANAQTAATANTTATASSVGSLVGLTSEQATYGLTGVGQTVAVIDSGVAYDNPALGGGYGANYRVVGGYDFAENDTNPYDDGPGGGHGTAVNGIIGSTNPTAPGVAPGVDLVDLRVFNDQGTGSFTWVDEALQWVHANRNSFEYAITTVNISIGSTWNAMTVPNWSTLEGDLAQLKSDGIFVSVAAGNSFTTYNAAGLSYPASSPSVVPVMSNDNDGSISSFSQRATNAIAAPGQAINSVVPDYLGNLNGRSGDDFQAMSGTSMAAPFLAGTAVLLREAMQMAGMTNITEDSIYNVMRNTADTVYDPVTATNYLRINVGRALASVMPADDYGATPSTGDQLGSTTSATVTGLIGTLTDHDEFTFTAATSGSFSATVTAKDELQPLLTRVGGASQSSNNGNTISFNVVAGQTYTLDLSSTKGIGRYSLSLQTTLTTTALGTVDFLQLAHQNLSGEQWYSVTATHTGILTAQSLAASVGSGNVTLFNSAQQALTPISGAATGREDVNVNAGDVVYIRVRGGASDGTLQVTNLVAQSGTSVNVFGTAGDDLFGYLAGANTQITIDGVNYQFSAASSQTVQFDGGAGNNSATLAGTAANQTVVLRPGSAQMSGPGGQVSIVNAQNIIAYSGGGSDSVTLYDTVGDSVFSATPTSAVMYGAGYHLQAQNFAQVQAHATQGNDRAYFYDSAGNDVFVASSASARMYGAGYNNSADGFDRYEAVSTAGQDIAYLSDSAGGDIFSSTPTLSVLYGSGYWLQAAGFSHVVATATQGRDLAYFYDSAGNDVFSASSTTSAMYGSGYYNQANGFDHVEATSTQGRDLAYFYDSPGNDIFSANPTVAVMYGSNYYLQGTNFEQVEADSTQGGHDLAYLYDSAGDDTLVASPQSATLSGAGYQNTAKGFGHVEAIASAGHDVATFTGSAGNDIFSGSPQLAVLYGANYYLQGTGFKHVEADAGPGGYDQAYLYDSAGNDTLAVDGSLASLYGTDFDNVANDFSWVQAKATTGANTMQQQAAIAFALSTAGTWR